MIWLWLFFLKGSITQYQQVEVVKTDTIYVKKPYKEIVIKEVEIEKPVKVFVYKSDTVYRQKLENDTLISVVQIEPRKATIHTITPKGIPLVKEFVLDDFKNLTIDHEGHLKQISKKKKKRLKRIKMILLFLCGVIVGSEFQ